MIDSIFENIIYSYTRTQALEDGVLVDVSLMAAEACINWPMAVTRRLWEEVIVPSSEGREQAGQSEEGRLWDTLWLLRSIFAKQLRPQTAEENIIIYKVYYVMGSRNKLRPISIKCVLAGDDNGSPCLTLMLPEED